MKLPVIAADSIEYGLRGGRDSVCLPCADYHPQPVIAVAVTFIDAVFRVIKISAGSCWQEKAALARP